MVATTLSSSPPPDPRDGERYLQYQRSLMALHRATGIPPSVKRLNGEVTKIGDLAIAGGTYSDIWLGMWLGEKKASVVDEKFEVKMHNSHLQVALKALRNIKSSNPKAQKVQHHKFLTCQQIHLDHTAFRTRN
jgi:hypothetical protein